MRINMHGNDCFWLCFLAILKIILNRRSNWYNGCGLCLWMSVSTTCSVFLILKMIVVSENGVRPPQNRTKKNPKKVFLKRKPFIFESDGLWVIFCFKLFFVSNVLRLKDVQGSVNLKIKKIKSWTCLAKEIYIRE